MAVVRLGTTTSTAGAEIVVDLVDVATSTDVFVQRIKIGHGADGTYNDVAATDGLPVAIGTTATLPVSVGTWTATGQVLTSPLSTATQPVSVGTWTATGIVRIDAHSTATIPVSISSAVPLSTAATLPVTVATGDVFDVSIGSTATVPVSVGTWTATGIVRIDTHSTATIPVSVAGTVTVDGSGVTQPVSVGTWTATGQVLTSPLSTATQPVSIGTWTATGDVNVATDRTYPVSAATTATQPVVVQNTATVAVSGDVTVVQPSATALNTVMRPFSLRGQGTQIFTSVSATARATIATGGGASVFRDLVWMIVSNNATSEAQLQIRDTSTATWNNVDFAPNGGGMVFAPITPAEQSAANGVWDVQLQSAIDGQVYIAAQFLDVT